MNVNIEFITDDNIINWTTIATTLTDGYSTLSTQSVNSDDLKSILSYAIPLACVTILLVVVFIGFRQRHRVLDRWTSLKRMKNTNPRFLQSVGLRRDSEFDSFNHEHVNTTSTGEENQYRLTTIT